MVKASKRPPKPTSTSTDSVLTPKATMPKPAAFHRRVLTQPVQMFERRRSKSSAGGHRRSFSSMQSSGTGEKKDSKFSSLRRELIRGSSLIHRRSRSLPQSAERSSKLQAPTETSLSLVPPTNKIASGKNFYVRVTLDSLTGISIQKGSKRKMKESERPAITGYASLLSSGHQLAVSMPFSVDHESPNSKLLWAGVEGERSRDKRQLHFSLQLQREIANSRDDDSATNDGKFHPKIVKMVIGLKCEDTKLPLGIATLVVNGKSALGEDVDLTMRPMDEMNDKKNKQLVPFFSSKKPGGISFFDDYFFNLSPDAVLRAHVDTKADEIGKTKRQVWGDIDHQNAVSRSKVEESRSELEGKAIAPPAIDTNRAPDHIPEEFTIPTPASPRSRRLKNENAAVPPIEFVDIAVEANSFTSDISSRRSLIEHPCEMTSNFVTSCFGGFCGIADAVDEEVNELKLSGDRYIPSGGGISSPPQPPLHNSAQLQQEMPGSPQLSSFDMAQKSYDDLRDAQETLRRYANRTGLHVVDILDQDEPPAQYTSLQV
ncbi:unnamed protein product [Cylindrotheca closterium]|uniref:C2 NT-type domain-containing protein n=1 Tax=Cylindrotheca closterium TaxID=2856 RepID=A0AAD2PV88_9STRA|nr:unnamed protein product [Cylindrotheca closterium]